jgi:type I restriction enzyme S subunit
MRYRYREAHEMKDSGIEWLGMIPGEWNLTKLRFLCEIDTGGKDTQDNIEGGTYPFFVRSDNVERINSYSFDGEAILTAGDGVGVGKVFHYFDGKFDFHQRVYKLSHFKHIHGKYLFYYIKENFYKEVIKLSAKSTVDSLRMPMFKDFVVSHSKIQEQQKIADFLDKKTAEFDALVEKKESFIAKLEEAKKSLISEVVTGKKRVIEYRGQLRVEDRRSDEMKYSGIEWLGVIPREWEIKRLKYILSERSLRSLTGIETPLSMSQKFGLIRTSEMTSIPNQSLNLIGNKICYPNDLVFNKLKAHLGVFSVAKEKGLVSPDYAVYYSESETTSIKYFEYLFKTVIYINEFKKYSSGVGEGLTRLYTTGLFGITSLYPNKKEQDLISDFITGKIEETNIVIEKIKIQIEKLKEAKQSLISEAVTGKIEVLD